MTTAEAVRQSAHPGAAVLALAEGIDQVLARLEEFTTPAQEDAWHAAFGTQIHAVEDPGTHMAAHEDLAKAGALANPYHLDGLREKLRTAEGDDIRAIEAQIRLAEDQGKALPPSVEEGIRLDVDGELVGFPAAGPERAQARAEWAAPRGIETFQSLGNALTPDEMLDAYVRGGPMWLYLYDREAIMRMPSDWLYEFIRDVEQDSPAQAQELARDILKDLDPDGAREAFQDAVTT